MLPEVVEEVVASKLIHAFIRHTRHIKHLPLKIVRPNGRLRISFGCLLRTTHRDQFLLVRNLHRPEEFTPLGGVIKCYGEAQSRLDLFNFERQHFGSGIDCKDDLRGFVRRKDFAAFLKWYRGGHACESSSECLHREIAEELVECGLADKIQMPLTLQFRTVRTVVEGPNEIDSRGYTQYRELVICDLRHSVESEQFAKDLFSAARSCHSALIVSATQIRAGRGPEGQLIGGSSSYLIGNVRFNGETPLPLSL